MLNGRNHRALPSFWPLARYSLEQQTVCLSGISLYSLAPTNRKYSHVLPTAPSLTPIFILIKLGGNRLPPPTAKVQPRKLGVAGSLLL
jgi:hypothetical protein